MGPKKLCEIHYCKYLDVLYLIGHMKSSAVDALFAFNNFWQCISFVIYPGKCKVSDIDALRKQLKQ